MACNVEAFDKTEAVNLEQDAGFPLKRTRAMFLAPVKAEVQRREALMTPARNVAEQGSPTRMIEELWDMVLKQQVEGLERRFEASRRALRGDLLEQMQPLRVIRKDGGGYRADKVWIHDPGMK